MPTSVLLSIKPQFANAILDGRKLYELRRQIFRDEDVRRIVIYASSPVRRVIGEFSVDSVLAHKPTELWSLTSYGAGVGREFFDDYFQGREIGFAIRVAKPKRYAKPRRLLEHYGIAHPPQSFCYLTTIKRERSVPSKALQGR